jgi:very-short-patch-repair endonuclease
MGLRIGPRDLGQARHAATPPIPAPTWGGDGGGRALLSPIVTYRRITKRTVRKSQRVNPRIRRNRSRTVKRAKELRREMTDAERKLWLRLNVWQLGGAKFRKQVPFDPYIADFASLQHRLIIELDGGQHDENRAKDERRTRYLEARG